MTDLLKIENILDILEEGILIINDKYKFEYINQKAKEILGITLKSDNKFHESGKLENGDIIIIADNILGCDDGNLTPKDLNEYINIPEKGLEKGDSVIAIGVYNNSSIKSKFRFWKGKESNLKYTLEEKFLDYEIKVCIDEVEKTMDITINKEKYLMEYLYSIGHIVVIDGKNGRVKFFQDKGYSYRNESIGELLTGKKFSQKEENSIGLNIVGQSIEEISGYEELYNNIKKALTYEETIKSEIVEIKRRPIFCTTSLIKEKENLVGVVVKIESISELQDVLRLRNDAINNIIKSEEHMREKIRENNAKMLTGISGNSAYINNVKNLGYKASKISSTVLITGESGTGKTLLAKEIHKNSNKKGKFIHVNCGAIPENLFESELFGYVKGSFTGASNTGKEGYFSMAKNGTIFLDEIGEVPKNVQPKLLHVLQEKQFFKIGDSEPTKANARVIAATNMNLEEGVKANNFRKDLYYRINVFPINIPPLRRRKKDLYVLINNIIKEITKKLEFQEKQLSGEAFEKLMDYDWPGNVRELENVLERAIIISETNIIYPEHINIPDENINKILKDVLEATEKKTIIETLDACNYNKKITMRKLGISKSAFYEKLKKYDIKDKN
ncbi:MAG: sigma 54-interacting transcriptional regulator [Eubacteriales bacterium]